MHALKAYASRRLGESEANRTKRWSRHGSTRYLWSDENVLGAISYVVHHQGEPMSVFPAREKSAP
jgi:hypothetical protein